LNHLILSSAKFDSESEFVPINACIGTSYGGGIDAGLNGGLICRDVDGVGMCDENGQ